MLGQLQHLPCLKSASFKVDWEFMRIAETKSTLVWAATQVDFRLDQTTGRDRYQEEMDDDPVLSAGKQPRLRAATCDYVPHAG